MQRVRSAVVAFTATLLLVALTVINPALAAPAKPGTTADHSTFQELQREFKSGPEVTQACLSCHTEASKQVMATTHWTWEFLHPNTNQKLGKRNVVNNYCIGIQRNEKFCTHCHVGYGFEDKTFDFTNEKKVDCLICHDNTLSYTKQPGMGGHVIGEKMEWPPGSGQIRRPLNLQRIAQGVGNTNRDTCGSCHFFGGGGDGVKHGDMDSSLSFPERHVDVHMSPDGFDFTCSTCHYTKEHNIPGSRFTPTAKDEGGAHVRGKEGGSPATCVACHGNTPHQAYETEHAARLDNHSKRIACQTCHIPTFARGGVPTRMSWDWSTAGKLDENGKQFITRNEKGSIIYESRKGDFIVAENVVPEYFWFNGDVTFTLLTDKFDPTKQPLGINNISGSAHDGRSMIWPFKVSRGKQPFDAVHHTLIPPHTTGPDGFWRTLDWQAASARGMEYIGMPFSGQIDFVSTKMYWPISHMVAPKEKSVSCAECHTRGGRLDGIQGIYITGRDTIPFERAVWLLVLLTLLGVLGHAALRIVSKARK